MWQKFAFYYFPTLKGEMGVQAAVFVGFWPWFDVYTHFPTQFVQGCSRSPPLCEAQGVTIGKFSKDNASWKVYQTARGTVTSLRGVTNLIFYLDFVFLLDQKVKNWTGYRIIYAFGKDEKIGNAQCQELDKVRAFPKWYIQRIWNFFEWN